MLNFACSLFIQALLLFLSLLSLVISTLDAQFDPAHHCLSPQHNSLHHFSMEAKSPMLAKPAKCPVRCLKGLKNKPDAGTKGQPVRRPCKSVLNSRTETGKHVALIGLLIH